MQVGENLKVYVYPETACTASLVEPSNEPTGMIPVDDFVAQNPDESLSHMAVMHFDTLAEARAYETAIVDMDKDGLGAMARQDNDGTAFVLLEDTEETMPIGFKPEIFDRRRHEAEPEVPTPS